MNGSIQNNRLKREIMDLDRDPPPGITCYPKDDNITKLEAYIKGPPDTPYAKGLFKLDVLMPNNYPFDPPQIRFVTRIYHPNIDDAGRICADILKKGDKGRWNPALNLRTTLLLLAQLLAEPNPDDPLDAQIAKEYQIDKPTFDQKALEFTLKFANEEAVMSSNQDQENEAKFEEKVNMISEQMESKEEKEEKEEAVETKPKFSLSLSKKKSNTGSSQGSAQHSSQSTQSSLASANSLSRKKKQSAQETTASSQVHESTTSSPVRNSPMSTKAPDSTAPSTLYETANGKNKSLKTSVAQIKQPKATNVNSEKKGALMDAPKDKIEQQRQTEQKNLAEKLEESTIVSKEKAKNTKLESVYFASVKAKATETVALSEQKPIKEVQVNLPKQRLTNDTQQQQQNNKKRHGNDIIVLSDDEDGVGVVHSLRLSKKLKRNTLSLSRQRK
ncbi:ubiquitin-conjugating enzyme E2 T [Mucor ambiguus]|uniref:E2 ubiquitin-conjugating enzyme n=1 Tax=Mucor ambiguus TaxID=91626 RepID=A0A0C9LPB0_9FUNG|nr:ubiquitin-conjugating enzyme E2 T [Mucor ambiguus]